MRKATEIKDKKLIDELLALAEDDCLTMSTIMNLLGDFGEGERCKPYDYFKVPENIYGPEGKKNKSPFYTTVGLWIFNKAFIEQDLFDLFQYIDEPVGKKTHNKINNELSYAVLEDKISLDVLKRFETKVQKFMPFVTVLSASYTDKMLTVTGDINKKKKELMKKYAKGIEEKDPKAMDDMEKELLSYAKELLKDDPSMDMFDSGARASFGNNFKNMFVSKGAVKHPDPNKGYDLITSSYMDGISKEDYPAFAASLSAGPYSRAKKTETGGYWEKLFLRAFQHLKLLPAGSDCGTTKTLKIYLTDKNVGGWMYSYIVDGNKLVELTSENKSKYLNKEVKIRFSALCEAKDGCFCNKCAGNLFYRLGIENVGSVTPQIPSKVKVLLMKKFHDSVINFSEMDVEKAFGFKK